jgi:hypothetical protein
MYKASGLSHLILEQPYELGVTVIYISQMRKKEITQPGKVLLIVCGRGQEANLSTVSFKHCTLTYILCCLPFIYLKLFIPQGQSSVCFNLKILPRNSLPGDNTDYVSEARSCQSPHTPLNQMEIEKKNWGTNRKRARTLKRKHCLCYA